MISSRAWRSWSWRKVAFVCYAVQAIYLWIFEPQVFQSLPRILLEVTRTLFGIVALILFGKMWSRYRQSRRME
jgi:hypothetical protein